MRISNHVFILLVVLSLTGCASKTILITQKPVQQKELNPSFPYQNAETVGVYIYPGTDQFLNNLQYNLFELDLKSRGYKTTNLSKLITPDINLLKNEPDLIDTIRAIGKKQGVKWFITSSSVWNSERYNFANFISRWSVMSFGVNVSSYQSRIIGYSTESEDSLFVFEKEGKGGLYYNGSVIRSYGFRVDPPWVLPARQISDALSGLPQYESSRAESGIREIPVRIVVDNSYRQRFPDWRKKIDLRILLANDHLLSDLKIKLVPQTVEMWNYSCEDSFLLSYRRLIKDFPRKGNLFTIGITYIVNEDVNWDSENALGMGSIRGYHCIVRAQPSSPSVSDWSPIVEGLTIAHEFGHNLGCVHTFDPKSLMYPMSGRFLFSHFDSSNIRIALSNLENPESNFPQESLLKLASVYEEEYNKSTRQFYFFGQTLGSFFTTLELSGNIDSLNYKTGDSIRAIFGIDNSSTPIQKIAASYVLLEKNKPEEALKLAEEAEKMDNQRAEIFLLKGQIHEKLNNYVKAMDAFQEFDYLVEKQTEP